MTNLVAQLSKRHVWNAARAKTAADNIAQAEVPGYFARKVKDFGAILATDGRHKMAKLSMTNNDIIQTKTEVSPDWEAYSLNETMLDDQATLALLKKYLSMLRTVFGRSGGGA